MKKTALCICLALCCSLFAGCQDYRGLDELTIVAGLAVDVDRDNPGGLALAFEIVDMTGSSESDMESKLVETKGLTMTEAVLNASEKLHFNMFFGNLEMLVVSEEIARDKGLQVIIDPLLRDSTVRDNLTVLISREKTAKEIITPAEDSPEIVSFKLNKAVGSGNQNAVSANATRTLELDQIYNDLSTKEYQLALPAIHFSNPEEKELEMYGLALFRDDRLAGFLEDDYMPWYLMTADKLEKGSINVFLEPAEDGEPRYFALALRRSTPKKTFAFDGEAFSFTIHVDLNLEATEFSKGWGKITEGTLKEMEERTKSFLDSKIRETAEHIRDDYGVDCLGFGAALNRQDKALWNEVVDEWPDWFEGCEIAVDTNIHIANTGLLKNF